MGWTGRGWAALAVLAAPAALAVLAVLAFVAEATLGYAAAAEAYVNKTPVYVNLKLT